MWLGPPDMKRKMARLARGGWCGVAAGERSARACSSSSADRATAPKPPARLARSCRRVKGADPVFIFIILTARRSQTELGGGAEVLERIRLRGGVEPALQEIHVLRGLDRR